MGADGLPGSKLRNGTGCTQIGGTLGTGEGGEGGTSRMVLDLLRGQWESETTTKPRHILELPEEEGRTRRWGGVARSQIAPGYFFFKHRYNRLDLVWLFLASFSTFSCERTGEAGI